MIYGAALKAWPRFEHQGRQVAAWLYTIAGRRVADFYRRRLEPDELHAALGQLGEPDRLAIDLYFFAGLSHQEASQVLGITPDAAAVRVHRALKRLGLLAAAPEPEAPRPEHKAELAERLMGAAARGRVKPARPAPEGGPVRYTVVSAEPLGPAYLAYTDKGICYLTTATAGEAEFVSAVRNRYGCEVVREDSQRDRWQGALDRWLAGEHEEVPLDLSRVTPFERTVLKKAQEIYRGAVRPYQWLAKELGKPGASRAIGGAMARNPIPLFIPCHRVVAASGVIGNYSMGGPVVKRRLLELEGVDVDRLHDLIRQGDR